MFGLAFGVGGTYGVSYYKSSRNYGAIDLKDYKALSSRVERSDPQIFPHFQNNCKFYFTFISFIKVFPIMIILTNQSLK